MTQSASIPLACRVRDCIAAQNGPLHERGGRDQGQGVVMLVVKQEGGGLSYL